jgi:virginiamycin B lyase
MKGLLATSLLAVSLAGSALGQRITEFPASASGTLPWGITVEKRHGYLAYTEFFGNRIRFMTTDGTPGPIFDLPTATALPKFICQGNDGALWVTLPGVNKIGRYGFSSDVPDGNGGSTTYREYTIPTGNSQPLYITAGSDGNVYATESNASKLIRIPYDGPLTEITTSGLTYGVDGSNPGTVLYTQPNTPLAVELPIFFPGIHLDYGGLSGTKPGGIVFGPDYAIWVLDEGANAVIRITPFPASAVSYPIPTPASNPQRIVNGPDGNLWFLETATNKLARITPSGVVTEYALPNPVNDMVLGPDGNFWIVESGVNKLLRFKPVISGDVNADGAVNVTDVFYLINFLFAGGPAPKL